MANKKLGILTIVFILGITFIGCDSGSTNERVSHDGTWKRGADQLIISGSNYTFRGMLAGTLIDVSRGTFIAPVSATSGAFAINQTQEINANGQLAPNIRTETGTFSIIGDTMILAGFSYFPINGTWIR